ncbi:MAG: hypothetical protein K2M17_01960 [Bacilli bacterium]|nr:hypothetical protein [Bacilli bacterium]
MDRVVKNIMNTLENAGYKAYLVGGYVRDLLMGRSSYDVDICTNAKPEDLYCLFNSASSNNYGGIHLKVEQFNVDITTFREELRYEKRRPVELNYIDDVYVDLQRRDFTVNAILMDREGHVIDPLGGVNDLNQKILRMIGNVSQKIVEDPLRILRAIRFVAVLDFGLDDDLYLTLKQNCALVCQLSEVRIKQEYSKILLSKNFQKGLDLAQELGVNQALGITYESVVYTSDLLGMWAQINFLNNAFTNAEKSNIIKITEVVNKRKIDVATLYKYGLYIAITAGNILGLSTKEVRKMYEMLPIKQRSDIKVAADEIIEILQLKDKRKLHLVYEDLEMHIVTGELENTIRSIERYLIENKGKW